MALGGRPIPVEFGMVFPDGTYAAGGIEMVRDFDRSSGDRIVQQIDKHTGLPLWVVEVIDAQDSDLRVVHDRRLEEARELAGARDREARAAELLRLQLAGAGRVGEPLHVVAQLLGLRRPGRDRRLPSSLLV